MPAWLAWLVPRPDAGLDRDPLALLLAALAGGLAAVYLFAALAGAHPRFRAGLIGLAGVGLVVAPTLAFIAMGWATQRPYGQDGGVVQLPLALDRILAGESPYGADYSDSILGKEARVSDFWAPYGGNPILHHHAYLPGTHLAMLPAYLLGRGLGAFDPRMVTLLAYGLAMLLAARLAAGPDLRLAAVAVVAIHPLVYWPQVFGANDLLVVGLVAGAAVLAQRRRPGLASAVLGLACATKQLAWPFAPFLLVHLAQLGSFRELLSREGLRRLARPLLISAGVFVAVVAPVASLDLARFWGDIVVYNVGLPGADNYPLGGTPGFGFANALIYFGAVSSLRDYFPFGVFYLLLVPFGLLLLHRQMRSGSAAAALVTGSAALLASLYFSRVVHPNYLVIPAILLPLGLLAGARWSADVAVVPLLLLAVAVEIADHEVLRTTWEQAVAVRLPQHLAGLAATLAPRAGPALTADPLGAGFSALAAGLALAYLAVGLLWSSPGPRLALALAALLGVVAVPALVVARVGEASGIVRAQHPWLAGVLREVRAARGVEGLPVREAWSQSFRRDPPAVLEPAPLGAGDRVIARLVALRPGDPRLLGVVALGIAAILILWTLGADQRALVLGGALLSPIVALGVPFGSPEIGLIAAVLASWALARSGRALAAGVLLGAAAVLLPRALVVAPFVAFSEGGDRRRAWLGLVLGWTALVAVALAVAPGPLWDGVGPGVPGLGLFNLFLYRGAGAGALASAFAWALPLAAGVAAWAAALAAPADQGRALAWGAAWLMVASWLAPGLSPHDWAAPLVLLLVAISLGPRAAGATPDPGPPAESPVQ